MYTCYILYSTKLDKYYIGYTVDMNVRLIQHNTGLSKFTARANDWAVKFCKIFPDRESAHAYELSLKRKKSRKYIEWLIATDSGSFPISPEG